MRMALFPDNSARKAIQEVVDFLGGGTIYWDTESPVILFSVEKMETVYKRSRDIREMVENKINALADALGYEFENNPNKVVAKKKEKKVK
jgi:hypothetical protein